MENNKKREKQPIIVTYTYSKAIHNVAIIGTIGRDTLLTKTQYDDITANATYLIEDCFGLKLGRNGNIHLVSGGAAWVDHVAVRLYLEKKVASLTLHLPCEWDTDLCKFREYGGGGGRGVSVNIHHKIMSAACGIDSLAEIGEVMKHKNVNVYIWDGFHQRNDKVATADYMIAYTKGETYPPRGSNAKYTWDRFKHKESRRIHIRLIAI